MKKKQQLQKAMVTYYRAKDACNEALAAFKADYPNAWHVYNEARDVCDKARKEVRKWGGFRQDD